ncbi:hypothetical protein GMORB2_2352 [Geosmithia morbida]|uniref:Uncharacterized protein n=1 Tax=Geosmithia morbida TaxID=1094350 RepID=A0A9P4YSJ3_9HYPO|nr:uncharacterized protein GMORB2_2352 [Geosmithia morbida]KAF4120866.1 hypothetical protein GMORB2_2352 [Geosmithia morbida]
MSAAWLTDTQSDDIRQIAVSVPQLATRAIISDLNLFFNDSSKITTIPAALLMSLFCMSSSLNWIDHRQLGLQYLVQARAVISVLDMRSWALSDDDRGLLAFFKHCLTYEEAVRSVVTSNHEAVHTDAIKPSSDILPLTDLTLHPWTGVPPKIISLLGKAMKVCRESRELWRNNTIATLEVMRQATVHICRGQDLEEMLLSVEVPSVSKEKDDSDFNIECHLYYATESFRLCSLLQLYLTFPDLVSRRLPQYVSADGLVPKARWLTPLALHITGLLLKIPHDSSMRCLQPLLCLCIGTGLRCDIGEDPESNNRFEPIYPASHMDAIGVAEENGVSSAPLPLDVRLARKFIVSRLEKLERGLPAKPIVILQKLLRAVWSSYDHETSGGAPHWIDIMTSLNYESVFG